MEDSIMRSRSYACPRKFSMLIQRLLNKIPFETLSNGFRIKNDVMGDSIALTSVPDPVEGVTPLVYINSRDANIRVSTYNEILQNIQFILNKIEEKISISNYIPHSPNTHP